MDFRFVVAKHVSQLNSVNSLDVGCNIGIMINQVNSGFKVGIDINVESLKIGKKSFPEIEFIAASAEFLPFRDSSFNLVISIHTLDQHSINQEKAILEIIRSSNKNSKTFLTGDFYDEIYDQKLTKKKNVHGWWICELEKKFTTNIRWYTKPKMKGLKAKFMKVLLTSLPEPFFSLTRIEDCLEKQYISSAIPQKGQPFIVIGTKN